MSPTVFRFGDSLRAYGLAALLLLLLLGAVWKVVEDPKPRRVAIFVLLSNMADAKRYLGEAKEKISTVAAKGRGQADALYAKSKEQ